MSSLLAFGYVLASVTTVLAWLASRLHPEHRPVALLLGFGLLSDLTRRSIKAQILTPARVASGGAPFTGWARVAFHTEQALFLAWIAGFTAAAVWFFLRRRPWPVATVWALFVVALASTYPAIRQAPLGRVYLGVQILALLVSTGAILTWITRNREPLGLSRRVVFFCIGLEVLLLVGPWRVDPFTRWDLAHIAYTSLYAVLIFLHLQGGDLWKRPIRTSISS